jgi:hypothetical protein
MLELPQMARGIGLGVWSTIAAFHDVATNGRSTSAGTGSQSRASSLS